MQSPRWLSWSEPVSPWRPVPLSPWPPGGAAGEGRDGDLRGLRLAGGNSSLEHSGPVCSPGKHPLFSAVWFAFSHPPHTSAPQKSKLSRGVLMATLPLCQSCVAGIAPSRSRAGFGLSLWADPPSGLERFSPWRVFLGSEALLRRNSPPPLSIPGTHASFCQWKQRPWEWGCWNRSDPVGRGADRHWS